MSTDDTALNRCPLCPAHIVRPISSRGLCATHYQKARSDGTIETYPKRPAVKTSREATLVFTLSATDDLVDRITAIVTARRRRGIRVQAGGSFRAVCRDLLEAGLAAGGVK